MSRVIAVLACGFSLAACSASVTSLSFIKPAPKAEALRIESEPPGADAKTSQGQSCRTPCELTVQTAGDLTVTLALAGYQPHTVTVKPEVPATGPQDRDSAGGAPHLAPNPVYVELEPMPATPAPKKSPPKKKAKPVTAAAHPAPAPAPDPAPAATAAAPVIAPTTSTAEPAASATQYPWPSR